MPDLPKMLMCKLKCAIAMSMLVMVLMVVRTVYAYKASQFKSLSEMQTMSKKGKWLRIVLFIAILINGIQWYKFGHRLEKHQKMQKMMGGQQQFEGEGMWNQEKQFQARPDKEAEFD
jgi:hypothetical protein